MQIFKSLQKYRSFHNRYDQFCKSLWITCGPVPGIFQTSITDVLNTSTTPTKRIRLHFFDRNLNGR
nr:MAG TPA: hypothetical protein [Caudoviricetes sp.]